MKRSYGSGVGSRVGPVLGAVHERDLEPKQRVGNPALPSPVRESTVDPATSISSALASTQRDVHEHGKHRDDDVEPEGEEAAQRVEGVDDSLAPVEEAHMGVHRAVVAQVGRVSEGCNGERHRRRREKNRKFYREHDDELAERA